MFNKLSQILTYYYNRFLAFLLFPFSISGCDIAYSYLNGVKVGKCNSVLCGGNKLNGMTEKCGEVLGTRYLKNGEIYVFLNNFYNSVAFPSNVVGPRVHLCSIDESLIQKQTIADQDATVIQILPKIPDDYEMPSTSTGGETFSGKRKSICANNDEANLIPKLSRTQSITEVKMLDNDGEIVLTNKEVVLIEEAIALIPKEKTVPLLDGISTELVDDQSSKQHFEQQSYYCISSPISEVNEDNTTDTVKDLESTDIDPLLTNINDIDIMKEFFSDIDINGFNDIDTTIHVPDEFEMDTFNFTDTTRNPYEMDLPKTPEELKFYLEQFRNGMN